jgi:hypothetical protein
LFLKGPIVVIFTTPQLVTVPPCRRIEVAEAALCTFVESEGSTILLTSNMPRNCKGYRYTDLPGISNRYASNSFHRIAIQLCVRREVCPKQAYLDTKRLQLIAENLKPTRNIQALLICKICISMLLSPFPGYRTTVNVRFSGL